MDSDPDLPRVCLAASVAASLSIITLDDGGATVKYGKRYDIDLLIADQCVVLYIRTSCACIIPSGAPILRLIAIKELHAPKEEGGRTRGGCQHSRSSTEGMTVLTCRMRRNCDRLTKLSRRHLRRLGRRKSQSQSQQRHVVNWATSRRSIAREEVDRPMCVTPGAESKCRILMDCTGLRCAAPTSLPRQIYHRTDQYGRGMHLVYDHLWSHLTLDRINGPSCPHSSRSKDWSSNTSTRSTSLSRWS